MSRFNHIEPYRLEGESYEEYKVRQKVARVLIKNHKRGVRSESSKPPSLRKFKRK